MDGKLKRCSGFGVNFSETDEICKQCENVMECLNVLANDQFDIKDSQSGYKLPILNALKPKEGLKPPVTVMIPKIMGDKILIEFYFNKEWLKRQLFGEDKKEK